MRRWQEITLLLVADYCASILALGVALWVRLSTAEGLPYALHVYILPGTILALVWIGLFAYVGLYGEWSTKSRLDELSWVVRSVFFGGIVLFLLTFDPNRPLPPTRIVLVSYGLTLIALSGAGRLMVRGFQRKLFGKGIGLANAIIVGTGRHAKELAEVIARYPRLGVRAAGFLTTGSSEGDDPVEPVLGTLADLPTAVTGQNARQVIFADPELSDETVLNAVANCADAHLTFSVVPDLYDVVVGRSGAGQLFGLPLMPLFPSAMPVWQRRTKRLLDVTTSLLGLVGGAPVSLLVAFAIRLEDGGPVFYSQERVGREGRVFRVHKFRSMVPNAEKLSGPVWAQKDDRRITRVGAFIRKTRFDEIPQFWNVLRGEMSLVGPRPERPFFVEKLAAEIPLYRRRLHVKPGLTGWAQTKQAYDTSLDDVREKLTYDLFYIENMSLRFDLVILIRTIWVVVSGKGAR